MEKYFEKLMYIIEVILWLSVVLLTSCTVAVIVYQVWALFLPYLISRGGGEFPHYFYRIYGENIQALLPEHYGYFGIAVGMVIVSAKYVVPNHPFQQVHSKQD